MNLWDPLEKRSATLFLVAGVIFVGDLAILAVGTEQLARELGQAFVGAGWTAAFIGLLGSYPELVDRSRLLARAGAVFAGIGAVVFAVMAVAVLVFFTGIADGDFAALVPIFLPGVIIGCVLGFVSFSVASLRSDVRSRSFGILLSVPAIIVVTNVLTGVTGIASRTTILAIVGSLVAVHSTIEYLLQTGNALIDRQEMKSPSDTAAR